MEKTDRKLNACLGLLVLIIAGVGWADSMLLRVGAQVDIQPIPVTTRWIDENGLEQTRAAFRQFGESDDAINARLRESVNVALKFFPCKEKIR